MSTTDEARLDAIDRRGRAAARTLLDDLAAREDHALVADEVPAAPPGPPDPAAVHQRAVIHLGRRVVRGGAGRPRRTLVAAAVVAVVAAVGGAVTVATRDDGGADVQSGGPLDPLLPGWLPTGLEPERTTDIPEPAAFGYSSDIAVYGDPDADDPWSATLAVVHLAADDEQLPGPPAGDETVTVAGHDATLREGFDDGEGWEVEWPVDDGRLIVGGALTRDGVLAAAEAATTEPAIDSSGLPDGYAELARGPNGGPDFFLFTSLFEGNLDGPGAGAGSGDDTGLAVTYADPADRDAVRTAVVVAQRPGPASAVDLLRRWLPDADATTVRGRHAVVGRSSEPPGSAGEAGVVGVQWAEPEGQLVTVVGFGVTEDIVLQVAEGLVPAAPGEVAALQDEHAVAAPRAFGELPAGHVVAASGASGTGEWRVVADARRQVNVGALTLERVWGAIGSTSSTTGDRFEPPLDLAADFGDGATVVWGALLVDAASVTVEAPGDEPIELGIHEVEGWSRPVVAGSFPLDHFGATDEVVVVARDADGQEVARNSTVFGPD